jgi:hypothetical protein
MRGLFSIKRVVFIGAFAAFLLPVSFSSGGVVSTNDVCASVGCCEQFGSYCHGAQNGTHCGNPFQR